MNRTQALVLSFFAVAWISLVAIFLSAPNVYDDVLRFGARDRGAEVTFLVAVTVLIAFLSTGVIRRWHWAFWVTLLAFLGGGVRIPVSILQLTGVLGTTVPAWYIVFQGVVGLVQVAIGVVMLADYRKTGVWGGS